MKKRYLLLLLCSSLFADSFFYRETGMSHVRKSHFAPVYFLGGGFRISGDVFGFDIGSHLHYVKQDKAFMEYLTTDNPLYSTTAQAKLLLYPYSGISRPFIGFEVGGNLLVGEKPWKPEVLPMTPLFYKAVIGYEHNTKFLQVGVHVFDDFSPRIAASYAF